MKIESIKLVDLKPLEQNVRKHNEKQIDELVRSVKQFGQTRAIVIDENNSILVGNGLYMAMVKMGMEKADCFRKVGLSEIEKKKLVLADNRIYSLGLDDYTNIQEYIQVITDSGDFDIAGFDNFVLEQMTMTIEDNTEQMKEYGKVNADALVESAPVNTTTNTVAQSNNSFTNESNEVTPMESVQVEQTNTTERQSVICPNCGEVIYID